MAADLDPRRHAYRRDIAAIALKGQVEAAQFVEPIPMQVRTSVVNLLDRPDANSIASQLLFGEVFDVYEMSGNWAWGQNRTDGYVGYVTRDGLGELSETNQTVTTILAHIYPEPNFKSTPIQQLPYMAQVTVTCEAGEFQQTPNGFISKRHLDDEATDFVAEAARFIGTPYLWGGRSPLGLDCSALVQLALMATGEPCPRDSDMQMDELGDRVESQYQRGDLIFWKGHVGIMFDKATLLHANVHHMCVAFESISEAIARIAKTDGPVLAQRRL